MTQEVDPASPVLGATVAKIAALAGRVDEVVVLADRAVEGVLPGNCRIHLFGAATRAGTRRSLRDGARARAGALAAPCGGGGAHVPDLRGARGAARATARSPGAALVHALAREQAAAGCRARLDRRDHRRAPVVSASVEEGHRDRPRHRSDRVRAASSARATDSPRLLSLGRTSPAKGIETIDPRGRRRCRVYGSPRSARRSPTRSDCTGPGSSASSPSSASATGS